MTDDKDDEDDDPDDRKPARKSDARIRPANDYGTMNSPETTQNSPLNLCVVSHENKKQR